MYLFTYLHSVPSLWQPFWSRSLWSPQVLDLTTQFQQLWTDSAHAPTAPNCSLFFAFPTEESKVAFVITLLSWRAALWEQGHPCCNMLLKCGTHSALQTSASEVAREWALCWGRNAFFKHSLFFTLFRVYRVIRGSAHESRQGSGCGWLANSRFPQCPTEVSGLCQFLTSISFSITVG